MNKKKWYFKKKRKAFETDLWFLTNSRSCCILLEKPILKFHFPDFPILTTLSREHFPFHWYSHFYVHCFTYIMNTYIHANTYRCTNAHTCTCIQIHMSICSTYSNTQWQAHTHMHAHISFQDFVTFCHYYFSVFSVSVKSDIAEFNFELKFSCGILKWYRCRHFLFLCSIQHYWFISGTQRGNCLYLSLLPDENSFFSLESPWTHLLSLLLMKE